MIHNEYIHVCFISETVFFNKLTPAYNIYAKLNDVYKILRRAGIAYPQK